MNRRAFVAAGLSAGAAGANTRVRIAVIGVRGQGRALAGYFAGLPDCEVAVICDIDPRVAKHAIQAVEQRSGKRPTFTQDLRRALDDRTIDAVAIATPDHWHAPATIMACDAGKDVYVEKPASHNLREGRLMVEAARHNRRIVQLGTQARSRPSTMRAVELVRTGRIGTVKMAKAWDVQLRDDIGRKADSAPPGGVDYDTWVGAAKWLPFNENRFHYTWHWNWNFGTGDIGNDGIHQLDIARWALGVESPVSVSGMGRKLFFNDDQQTPDTMNLTFDFGSALLQYEMRIWNPYGLEQQENGVAVYGSAGMIHIGRWIGSRGWGYKIYDEKGVLVESKPDQAEDRDDDHARNFIACVKSRRTANAEIAIGHASTTLSHLGNIVARTGRNLTFDAKTESIAGDPEADALTRREYRRHWSAPAGV